MASTKPTPGQTVDSPRLNGVANWLDRLSVRSKGPSVMMGSNACHFFAERNESGEAAKTPSSVQNGTGLGIRVSAAYA